MTINTLVLCYYLLIFRINMFISLNRSIYFLNKKNHENNIKIFIHKTENEYDSHMHSESINAASKVERVSPVFSSESKVVDGEIHGDGTAHGFAYEVELVQLHLVDELFQVAGEAVQGPGVLRSGHVRQAHAPHIEADNPVMPGNDGHPAEPHLVALGHAVVQDDGFWLVPWIGKIVDLVEELGAVGQGQPHVVLL